ncbi:Uncharacterised protein [Vibrio cholerae]|nr:Uncharacterised protein [Vibrio cholerae]
MGIFNVGVNNAAVTCWLMFINFNSIFIGFFTYPLPYTALYFVVYSPFPFFIVLPHVIE